MSLPKMVLAFQRHVLPLRVFDMCLLDHAYCARPLLGRRKEEKYGGSLIKSENVIVYLHLGLHEVVSLTAFRSCT